MKNKKELLKTIILTTLIISSLMISYLTTTYKPEISFLKNETEFNKENKNSEKTLENSIKLLSPYIIIQNETNKKEEEVAVKNAITKAKNVNGIKNKKIIKEIIKEIASKKVEITRIKNKSIEEILSQNQKYFLMKYKVNVDTLITQEMYLGKNNQNTKLNFDTILLSENEKNTIYLYEQDQDGYMQITFVENIYDEIEKIFNNNKKIYKKYLISANKDFYIGEKLENFTIDEYEIKKEDSKAIFKNIFKIGASLKTSKIAEDIKETSDGYVILREEKDKITYINPSNIEEKRKDENKSQTNSSNFLISIYNYESYYNLVKAEDEIVNYQESYKDSMAFSDEIKSNIDVNITKKGVSKLNFPKITKGSYITSKKTPLYYYENIDVVLNYLYSNIDINNLYDVELAYKKMYKEDKIIYSPAWYINYKGKYYNFKDFQKNVKKGEI